MQFPITQVNHSVIYDKTDQPLAQFVESSLRRGLLIGGGTRYQPTYYGESVGAVEHCIVGKTEVMSQSISYVAATAGTLALDIKQSKKLIRLLGIIIQGYSEDPRELWNIREVKSWYSALHEMVPYLLYFLHPLDIWVYAAMFGQPQPLENNSFKIEGASAAAFLDAVFDAGNGVCRILSEGNDEVAEQMISEATKRIRYALFEKPIWAP